MKNNPIATFVKSERKKLGLTQVQFALISGVGLAFLRALEQGKESIQVDNVNRVLNALEAELVPVKKNRGQ